MMRVMKCMVVTAIALAELGCVTHPKMDASSPIEIDRGFFAVHYKQDGHPIDPSDMVDQLEKQPEASSHVTRARVLGVIAGLLAGAGGFMVGLPAGQAAAGERKPIWPLAAAGGAVIGLSIPFAIWSGSSMDSAVEAHNRSVASSRANTARGGAMNPDAPPPHRSEVAPGAFGFVFGASVEEAAEACRKAGLEWLDDKGAARCSGAPSGGIADALVQLEFEDNRLAAIELVIRPPDDAGNWAGMLRETEIALRRLHGKPQQRSFVLPDECKASEEFLGCVADGRVSGSASWSTGAGGSVALSIAREPAPPTIRVRVAR